MMAADDTICCLLQMILDCQLRNWSHLRLLPGGDEYDYGGDGGGGDEYTDHGDYQNMF